MDLDWEVSQLVLVVEGDSESAHSTHLVELWSSLLIVNDWTGLELETALREWILPRAVVLVAILWDVV